MRSLLRQFGPVRRLWYEGRIRRCPPVLVFQMGRVGSYAVHRSLFNWWPGVVLHAHHLWDRYEDAAIRAIDRSCFGGDRPVYIISLVREPIARNVSAFFEAYEWYFGETITESEKTLSELQETFLREYRHSIPLVWFDERLFPTTDIDVYETAFPSAGHQQYRRENVNLLVLRTDLDNARKATVINDFLPDRAEGAPNITRKNAAEDKPHRNLYWRFKDSFSPPSWYVDYMYRSKYARHFFGEEERRQFRQRWSKTSEAAA